jgi:HAMP domain-containing protein
VGQVVSGRGPVIARPLRQVSLRVRLVAAALCLLAAGAMVITLAGVRVARGYLMAQAGKQLRAYAAELASRSFEVSPIAPPVPGPATAGADRFSIEVRGSVGQLVLRAGPSGRTGLAAWAAQPRLGQLSVLPGLAGHRYLAVAEPIHYRARRIPFAYSADDFSLLITSRAGPGLAGTLVVGLDLASIDGFTGRLATVGLAVGGVALLAVGGLAVMALGALLRPFRRLEAAATAVAGGGPAPTIAAGRGHDDPGRLLSPLNPVLGQLNQARQEAGAPAAAARASTERLRQAVAEITGELRRPVSVLHGLAGYARRQETLPPAERERVLRRMAAEVARIEALTSGLRCLGQARPGPRR